MTDKADRDNTLPEVNPRPLGDGEPPHIRRERRRDLGADLHTADTFQGLADDPQEVRAAIHGLHVDGDTVEIGPDETVVDLFDAR